ncbi:hypothetical protein CSB45_13870 [candidate division KSB3 bacterium]|uniref:Uncharacterized protein n=1 Tax=candidate division KSB3 bacterium TaxID=2044937 RepID=A0A2G6E1X5_9BACT|nr:MAG: hypothetical protein CSB45_13870 [candidate division KSB3 bacterium]PIE28505.1 MAG: hypothetical protein CSA57_13445 [candidate division KSB3 bacterium]
MPGWALIKIYPVPHETPTMIVRCQSDVVILIPYRKEGKSCKVIFFSLGDVKREELKCEREK